MSDEDQTKTKATEEQEVAVDTNEQEVESASQVATKVSRPDVKSSLTNMLTSAKSKTGAFYILAGLLVVSLGVGSGWLLAGRPKAGVLGNGTQSVPGAKQGETEAGLEDESTFRDSAEGTLEVGGIDGEGTHHLVREGGESQNVYLTSTVIDLESFAGKKVKVWGETISARKAGWLMDVGKIKVVE